MKSVGFGEADWCLMAGAIRSQVPLPISVGQPVQKGMSRQYCDFGGSVVIVGVHFVHGA